MRKSLFLLLALVGLFDSLYLLWVYTSPTREMVCLGGGCDAVRLSVYSHFWGIPMPVFGAAGYAVVALLIVAESLARPALAIEVRYALAGGTGFGFLFSLYLEYLQGFKIHAFCAWCVTSGLVMTVLFALAVYNVSRPVPEDEPTAQLTQMRSYFVVVVVALAIGVPAFYELSIHGEVPPPLPPSPTDSMADKLVRPDSHATGNLNAPLTVVEFGDFECPICGREEPVAEEIRSKYADRVRFVFRQFPLIHIHPFAQRVAEASECAAEQGKFWQAVTKIYSRQDNLSEGGLNRVAAEIGLDRAKFQQCMASGAEAARVNRDREDGKALGVDATPTFFIGHQVVSGAPEVEELSRDIDQELATAGTVLPAAVPSEPTAHASIGGQAQLPAAKKSSIPAPTNPQSDSSAFGLLESPPGGALSGFQSGVTCSESEAAKKQPTLINTSGLRELLAAKTRPLFVDVRAATEYAKAKIPGAINIPVDDMPRRWNTLPRDRMIVFYESGKSSGDICASGRAAGRIMLQKGYASDQIKVFQDGLAGWQKSGLGTGK